MEAESKRLQREREYHDSRFTEEVRFAQWKYYDAIRTGETLYKTRVRELSEGADIFELGCGLGKNSFANTAKFRTASGIDISSVAVDKANAEARLKGLENISFICGDAENIPLPDESFDLIYGNGIIHHLNVDRCINEVARLLRPTGSALFWEPLGHNPIFNVYRTLTPKSRTSDEHPLLRRDFHTMSAVFPNMEVEFFGLTTLATVPLRKTKQFATVLRAAERLDRALFSVGFGWNAWYALSLLRKCAQ